MKKIYVVTGANGHLGGTLVLMLSKRGETVRGLVLPGENPVPLPHVRYMRGDVRDADSDRKSTRLNSSHERKSYAVFCLKKKKGK